MSVEFDPKEEHCFNVYWKIKNFSYCVDTIKSPGFFFSGYPWCIELQPKNIECRLLVLNPDYEHRRMTYLVSFLPSDGSPPLHGYIGGCLRVSKDVLFGTRRSAFLPKDTLTVRFRYPTISERGTMFVHSLIGVKREYFLWTIKSSSSDKCGMKKMIERSEHYGDIDLTLKSKGGYNTDEQFYIEVSRKGTEKCYCFLKVSVLDVDGNAVNGVSDEFVFEKKDVQQNMSFPPIIKKRKLITCKDLLLQSDTLSLKCYFAISVGTVTDQTSVISYCTDVTPLAKGFDDVSLHFKEKCFSGSVTDLQTDLKNMLDDKTLCDVSLHIGSEVIRAHKSILCARSGVFRELFTKDVGGTKTSSLNIEHLDVKTVHRLLHYMYTDCIHDYGWEGMKNLYFASQVYGVFSLSEKCSSFLKTNLTISNVCEILVVSDLDEDEELKKAVLQFISEHSSEVFALEEWKKLEGTKPAYACKILREICCSKKEN